MAIAEGFGSAIQANGSQMDASKSVEEYDLVVVGGEPSSHTPLVHPGTPRYSMDTIRY